MTDESRGPGPWTIGQPDPDPFPPAAQSPGHSPGPWQVRSMAFRHHASGRLETHYWIEAGTDRPIPLDTRLSPEARANALLLAASPDLLAACRAALERLKADGDPFTGPDWELGHRLSAAIGKATDPDYPS